MEFSDAMIGSVYKNKKGEEKISWFKIGRLAINGDKMTLFTPLFAAPVQFFEQKEKEASAVGAEDADHF
jgi:hypothetical protein